MVDDSTLAIVLAGGRGLRMGGTQPKVLHTLGGVPLLARVCNALKAAGLHQILVILPADPEPFNEFRESHSYFYCSQLIPNGTGGAVAASAVCFGESIDYAPGLRLDSGQVLEANRLLIVPGDSPLLEPKLIAGLVKKPGKLGVAAMQPPDCRGYGRLTFDDQGVLAGITEEKDGGTGSVCNSGVYVAERDFLFSCLADLNTKNSQQEYYLTDCVAQAYGRGQPAWVYTSPNWRCFLGVNTPEQLKALS